MITRHDMKQAAVDGVITKDIATALIDYFGDRLPASDPSAEPPGEEPLRFIRNFHDVFLAMGIQILAAGIFAFGAILLSGRVEEAFADVENMEGFQFLAILATEVPATLWFAVMLSAIAAGLLWLLAEYFAFRKRLFFPAIIICLNFAFAIAVGALSLYAALFFRDAGQIAFGVTYGDPALKIRLIPVYIVASALLPVIAYYIRFKLPFAMGLIGIGVASLVVTAIAVFNWSFVIDNSAQIVLLIGILIFLFGMAFDIRDPARVTRFSDNGFWLHFIAAPCILIGLKASLFGWENWFGATPESAPVLLGAVAVFAVISLLINRRALVVSGMITVGAAIASLLGQTGMAQGGSVAATLLALGAFMVMLGAAWHWLRGVVLKPVPASGFIARVFPPEGSNE